MPSQQLVFFPNRAVEKLCFFFPHRLVYQTVFFSPRFLSDQVSALPLYSHTFGLHEPAITLLYLLLSLSSIQSIILKVLFKFLCGLNQKLLAAWR